MRLVSECAQSVGRRGALFRQSRRVQALDASPQRLGLQSGLEVRLGETAHFFEGRAAIQLLSDEILGLTDPEEAARVGLLGHEAHFASDLAPLEGDVRSQLTLGRGGFFGGQWLLLAQPLDRPR